MKTFFITTLGCKVNQYESEAISQCLTEAGWAQAPFEGGAHLCIINTCTVTGKASMQSRQAIRQVIRNNPESFVIVTGCYAQTEAEEIRKIDGVGSVVGHTDKHKIPAAVLATAVRSLPDLDRGEACTEKKFRNMPVVVRGKRSRPFLKIQDGCDSFCTYCIVPYTRGRSRSMLEDDVLSNLKQLTAAGYREAVLTGIHVGCYGLDLNPETSLQALFERIEREEAIERLRLSSIEPTELTDGIVDLVAASSRFCDHFHIPLQSGDDGILKRMHRPYDSTLFRNLLKRIHAKIPSAAIGVDTLIGFPGETQEAFENTYNLIKSLPVTYLHVFPFSPRKGTPASTYTDQVPGHILKERCARMRTLGLAKKRAFFERQLGKEADVLFEGKRDSSTGLLKGISGNYVTVLAEGKDALKNTVCKVTLTELHNDNAVIGVPTRAGKK